MKEEKAKCNSTNLWVGLTNVRAWVEISLKSEAVWWAILSFFSTISINFCLKNFLSFKNLRLNNETTSRLLFYSSSSTLNPLVLLHSSVVCFQTCWLNLNVAFLSDAFLIMLLDSSHLRLHNFLERQKSSPWKCLGFCDESCRWNKPMHHLEIVMERWNENRKVRLRDWVQKFNRD